MVAYKNPEDQRASARRHYLANRQKMIDRAAAHSRADRRRLRELVRAAKARPCADCGVVYPYYVMQFDHVGDKAFTIGTAIGRGVAVDRVFAEIEKCEVVCANCHAERTHRRGQCSGVRVVRVDDELLTLF